jgi:hypothetical protein
LTSRSIECESRIRRVTVYARGAVVARELSLPPELPEEATELTVKGITALAEPGSIRAIASGGREVVALRSRYVAPPPPASPGSLLDRLRELHLERIRLRNERAHLKTRRDMLSSMSLDPGMARAFRHVDPTARVGDALALSGMLTAELAELDARVAAIDEAIEANERARKAAELAAAQAKSAELEGEGSASVDVLVRLAPGGAAAVRSLEIEYVVRAARWFPAYAARFSAGATRVELSIAALVAQASGEDWDHVELSLSTADLVTDARLPELASLRLGRAQPSARKGYRAAPEGLDALFEGYDRFVAEAPRPALSPRRRALPPVTKTLDLLSEGGASPEAMETTPVSALADDSVGQLTEITAYEREQVFDMPTRLTLPSADGSPRTALEVSTRGGGGAMMPQQAPGNAPYARPAAAAPVMAMQSAAAPARAKGGLPFGLSLESRSANYDEGDALTAWEPAAPAAIEPADAWLDFDALELKDPADRAARGRLVRDDPSASAPAARMAHAAAKAAITAVFELAGPPHARDPRESRGYFDHRYDAEGRGDIPSNGRLHRVDVAVASAPAAPKFITVPREAAEVYREVEIKNPFPSPLLAGPVEVFVDGALLTQSSIGHVDRGGLLLLGLGVEDRIRVARNARVEEGSAGLLGGSTTVEHAVTIDLTSSLGREIEVTVLDRVPVTDDKDVEIKTLYAKPPAEPYTQAERGHPIRKGLRWHVPVPAGGKARVELGYRITLPSKCEIVGGNRREG